MTDKKLSYIELPCERCGSPKIVSKPKKEKIHNSFGTSIVEVSMIICTNSTCQNAFEKQRIKDLIAVNNRKIEKEERDRIRIENTAKAIAMRRKIKFQQERKLKKNLE